MNKPKLLLHICCVGCGVYTSQVLKQDYGVVLFYFNPNIFPEDEYLKRLAEAEKIAQENCLELIIGDYDHGRWLEAVKNHENDPEKGDRCTICYRYRLEQAALKAKDIKAEYFATTLTTSPHKDAQRISRLGREIFEKTGINFLDRDFKKQDGFKKSTEISKSLGLYRQNYCGCEFSRRKEIN